MLKARLLPVPRGGSRAVRTARRAQRDHPPADAFSRIAPAPASPRGAILPRHGRGMMAPANKGFGKGGGRR
ncbi:hypothetical protein ATO13_20924 [Stappia sp. 22II-S9-Z10]|nr:hypothetical protein ATO13_20924 [Stappia sp. 22II-S9-Z10]